MNQEALKSRREALPGPIVVVIYFVLAIACLCALLRTTGCDNSLKSNEPRDVWAVGIPSNHMSIHAAQQQGQNWCWAASIQMVLSCHGISVSQREIVTHSFGVPLDRPGGPKQFVENLSGWFRTRSGVRLLRPQINFGPPSIDDLTKSLEQDSPVIIAIHSPGTVVGHAVVVTAAIFRGTQSNPELVRVIVRDPALPFFGGKRELPAAEFRNTGYHLVLR